MLVYQATKSDFLTHVARNEISDRILAGFLARGQSGVSPNEVRSWQNSLQYMRNVLDDVDIPDDAGVALEFKVPQTSKRIDFILTGFGRAPRRRPAAVIVELKQWEHAEATPMDGVVRTFVGRAERDVPHPSYQAWSYAALLEDYNEAVEESGADLRPCAYLHNCTSTELGGEHYRVHLARAPLFL